MQRVHLSGGKALCRFCGERIATNNLSTHIAKAHPRPAKTDMTPTLVRKHGPAKRPVERVKADRNATFGD